MDTIEEIMGLNTLNDNWDGYGALAPKKESIDKALEFVTFHAELELPFYFVSPGVNGEVVIELKSGNRSAELFFNPDTTNELLLFQNTDCIFTGNFDNHLHKLINFYKSNQP